jgi:hypothetical protein
MEGTVVISKIFRQTVAVVVGLSTVSFCLAQEPSKLPSSSTKTAAPASLILDTPPNGPVSSAPATVVEQNGNFGDDSSGGFLTSDRGFPNFIGFISNPTRNIDPRSLTQLFPIFTYAWTDPFRVIPNGQLSAYGAGLDLALTERLSVGLTDGSPVWAHFNRQRTGWTNIGGFAQYTLIRDTDDQFLLTLGLSWEAPSGSKEVFQGSPPAYLAPYLTIGKEFGCFHILATTGYNFPAESATLTTRTYYANFHFDYRVAGWFYPLVEFNGSWPNRTLDFTPDFAPGLIEIDRFDGAGGIFTVAPGFNAVLVQDRLEVGAVYETPIWSQHNFNFNSLLVKMIVRF